MTEIYFPKGWLYYEQWDWLDERFDYDWYECDFNFETHCWSLKKVKL